MKIKKLFIIVFIFMVSACQSVTETSIPTSEPNSTSLPATQTPNPTATFIPVSAKDLVGLIISSPILGTPQEYTDVQPPEMITPNGLGIINSEGELIKFTGAGIFETLSPSGIQIVYQEGFIVEYTERIDNLHVYNSATGKTVEIIEDRKYEGGKSVFAWLEGEEKFIYYNDRLEILFEAFGYFEPKQLFLADIQTGRAKLLLEGYQFDVSPDGTQIAYTTGEILDSKSNVNRFDQTFGCFQPYIYSIASSSSIRFNINQMNEKPICIGYPTWSPDGEKIAWVGYFANDTFRPIIFNLNEGTSLIYKALDQKPESTNLPAYWSFGNRYGNPHWLNNSTYWAISYEVNIENNEISIPSEIAGPYHPGREYIDNPRGTFSVAMNEKRDLLLIIYEYKNKIASFNLNDIYFGERYEIRSSVFGINTLVSWSPFAPPPNIGNP